MLPSAIHRNYKAWPNTTPGFFLSLDGCLLFPGRKSSTDDRLSQLTSLLAGAGADGPVVLVAFIKLQSLTLIPLVYRDEEALPAPELYFELVTVRRGISGTWLWPDKRRLSISSKSKGSERNLFRLVVNESMLCTDSRWTECGLDSKGCAAGYCDALTLRLRDLPRDWRDLAGPVLGIGLD